MKFEKSGRGSRYAALYLILFSSRGSSYLATLFHKLSYEILKDKQLRKRFDRYEMLEDPKAAMSRAASGALFNGIKGVGMGVFNIGAFAVKQIVRPNDKNEKRV